MKHIADSTPPPVSDPTQGQGDAPLAAPAATPTPSVAASYVSTPFASNTQAANCNTFGEKLYSGVFDWGINFGVNLVISAGFTQWTKHSRLPIWKNAPIGKNFFGASPESAFNGVRDWMKRRTGFSEDIANRMADALTLTTAGTAVMVPSVWLGAKIKSDFIRAADGWWYGKQALDTDPWLEHRHALIEDAPKATLAGAVIGRAGTMLAVQAAAIGIGDRKNAITWLGKQCNNNTLQKFKGLDFYSVKIGHAAGSALTDAMPKTAARLDGFAQRIGFGHSTEQIKLSPNLISAPYTGAMADYTRYSALDTMYTLVTMSTIHPIIHAIKQVIPGMTYKDESKRPKNRVTEASRQGLICERTREVSA